MNHQTEGEDEQLLQDASTLLMFANTAAMQQQKYINHRQNEISYQHLHENRQEDAIRERETNLGTISAGEFRLKPFKSDITAERYVPDKYEGEPSNTSNHVVEQTSRPDGGVNDSTINDALERDLKSIKQDEKQIKLDSNKPFIEESQGNHVPIKSPPSLEHNSPGPASVTLSGGINFETKTRNSQNAMLAAAALAAAADVPLPLSKKREEEQVAEIGNSRLETKTAELREGFSKQINGEVIPKEGEVIDKNVTKTDYVEINRNKHLRPDTSLEHTDQNSDGLKEPFIDRYTKEQKGFSSIVSLPTNEEDVDLKEQKNTESTVRDSRDGYVSEQIKDIVIPSLEEYKVSPDSGLIGCICGVEEDDGFTIQCDICFRWQHCLCMGYNTGDEVPEDEYKCYYCDKSKWTLFDFQKCREKTLKRIEQETLDEDTNEKENVASKRKLSPSEKIDDKKKRKTEKSISMKEPSPDTKSPKNDVMQQSLQQSRIYDFIPNYDNELLEDGCTTEAYQGVYYKVMKNHFKNMKCESLIKDFTKYFHDTISKSRSKIETDIELLSSNEYNAIKFSDIILPNRISHRKQTNMQSKHCFNGTSIEVKSIVENSKQKFNGLSKYGVFISNTDGKVDVPIPEGISIMEYCGEIDLFDNYVKDPLNQYLLMGVPKPHVLRIPLKYINEDIHTIELVLDSRSLGNETRFIRKSCPATSNCKLRKIFVSEANEFRYIVQTSKPISLSADQKEKELKLEWDWDDLHPIKKMYPAADKDIQRTSHKGLHFDDFSDDEKAYLIKSVHLIRDFIECGCDNDDEQNSCAISKVKKATAYLLRFSRKASNLSAVNLSKSCDDLIDIKKSKHHSSWKRRSEMRDKEIKLKLKIADSPYNNILSENDSGVKASYSEGDGDHFFMRSVDNSPKMFDLGFLTPSSNRTLILRHNKLKDFFAQDQGEDSFPNINKVAEKISEIPIPLVSTLYMKIEDEIDQELKLLKLQSDANSADMRSKSPKDDRNVTLKNSLQPKNVTLSTNVSTHEKSCNEPLTGLSEKPTTVKKLSFADYKKKMK